MIKQRYPAPILAALNDDKMLRKVLVAAIVVLALLPLNLIQHQLLGWSNLVPIKIWLTNFSYAGDDSWRPMQMALDYVRSSDPSSIYETIFFQQKTKFQYAPTALLPLAALQSLGIGSDASLLNNLNRGLILLNALGVGWLFHCVLRQVDGRDAADSLAGRAGAALAALGTLLFYPMMMGFWLGQVQVWINTAFTFACIAWLRDRKVSAGALIGLICLLKPQFGVFAVWALIRREWRFMGGAATVLVPAGAASLLLFGWAAHLDYLRVLSFLSQRGEAMVANQAINGVLNALMGTADRLVWDEHGFPAYNVIVHAGTAAAAAVLISGAILRPRRSESLNGLLDFQIAALAFTMASPIAWEHHFGIMPPIFATLFCCLVAARDTAHPVRRWLLLGGLFLASSVCVATNQYGVATPLNLAQGYLTAAGLGVIFMLWRAEQRSGPLTPSLSLRRASPIPA